MSTIATQKLQKLPNIPIWFTCCCCEVLRKSKIEKHDNNNIQTLISKVVIFCEGIFREKNFHTSKNKFSVELKALNLI